VRYFPFLLLALAGPAMAQQTTVTTTSTGPAQPVPVTEASPVTVQTGTTPLSVTVTNPGGQVTIPTPLPVTVPTPLSVTTTNPTVIPNPLPVTESSAVAVVPGTTPLNVTVTNPPAALPSPLPVTVSNPTTVPNPLPVVSGSTPLNVTVTNPNQVTIPNPLPVTESAPVKTLPANTGGATGGVAAPLIMPNASVPIIATTVGTTQLVSANAGQAIYVTEANWTTAVAGNVQFVYGTGTNCGTGQHPVTGVYTFAAANGLADSVFWVIPAGNALCVITSTVGPLGGSLSLAQF